LPEYVAVTVLFPKESWEEIPVEVVKVAVLLANPSLSVTGEPTLLPLRVNCTVPVASAPSPITVAVNVTAWP
jgi:hypothetical protein